MLNLIHFTLKYTEVRTQTINIRVGIMKSIILVATLALAAPAFADNTQTINELGQLAGAFGVGANANTSLTTPPVLYSDAALKGMDCLGLELAKNKINNAVNRTKANATDLLETEKAKQGQTKSTTSAAADMAALIIAQRGGKNAEYAKMYQNMQGDSSANSNALDIEIKNLENMNEQLSEIQIYQKYKSCPGTVPTYVPPPVVAPVIPVAPVATVTQTTVTTKVTPTKKPVVKKKVVKKKAVKKTTK